jgi:hypothetical protein
MGTKQIELRGISIFADKLRILSKAAFNVLCVIGNCKGVGFHLLRFPFPYGFPALIRRRFGQVIPIAYRESFSNPFQAHRRLRSPGYRQLVLIAFGRRFQFRFCLTFDVHVAAAGGVIAIALGKTDGAGIAPKTSVRLIWNFSADGVVQTRLPMRPLPTGIPSSLREAGVV